jgi:hypothetical protein
MYFYEEIKFVNRCWPVISVEVCNLSYIESVLLSFRDFCCPRLLQEEARETALLERL